MTLRAFPFKTLQFHGKNTCSWIAFIPPYCTMPTNTMDLEKKAHFDNVSYGRLILVFKCRLASRLSHPQQTVERDLAFIEELWPYTPTLNHADVLGELFDCRHLYRTSPKPTYYVIPVSRILGDAPILADPVTPTIPFRAQAHRSPSLHGKNPCSIPDSWPNKYDGSKLFVVNRWAYKRGRRESGMTIHSLFISR